MHTIPPPEFDSLLTEAEAADLLSLSVRTLQAWRYAHRGPRHCRLGRCGSLSPADLLVWIEAQTSAPGIVRDEARA